MEEFDFIWDSESEGIENNIINSTEASSGKGAGVADIINSDEDIFPTEKPATEVDKDNLELENVRNSLFSTDGVTLGESLEEGDTTGGSAEGGSEESTGNEGPSANSLSAVDLYKNGNVLKALKESGMIELEEEDLVLEEGEEFDEDLVQDLINQGFEKRVDSKIAEMAGNLPDSSKSIINFLMEGGSPDLLPNMLSAGKAGIVRGMDLEDDNNLKAVAKQMFIERGDDPETAESFVQHLEDTGKLKTTATNYYDKWLKEDDAKVAEETSKIKKARAASLKSQAEFKKTITDVVTKQKEISSYTLPKTAVKEIPSYLSDANIELENGKVVTPFQRDLLEALKDPEKSVLLATIIKSGFDFTPVAKKAASNTTRALVDDIQRQKGNKTIKSERGSQPKRLTDLIN